MRNVISRLIGWRGRTKAETGHVASGTISAPVLAGLRQPEPRDVGQLAEFMDADYQVQLAKRVVFANLKAIDVSFSVEGGDERSEALAGLLSDLWKQSLPNMQEAFSHGRVAFEKVWDYADGLSYVRKLESLPWRHSELCLNEDGRFDGIKLKGRGEQKEKIPIDRAWWLALDPTALEPHGRSRYLGAPEKVWKWRREAFELRSRFLRRFVIRGGTARVPPTIEDEQTGEIKSGVEAFAKAVEAFFAGGTLILPNSRHPDAEGEWEWTFNEAEVRSLDPTPIDNVIDGLDVEMLRAFGIPEKTVIEGQAVGSFAMVTQQMLILFSVVEDVLDQFIRSFQRYVIDKCVEYNFGADSGVKITIGYVKLTNRPDSMVAELLKLLFANPTFSQALLSGAMDVRSLLEQAGLPVAEEFERVLAETAARVAATQQAMGVQLPQAEGLDAANPAGGEFGELSRRQWQRNTSAIRDVIAELREGDMTPLMATELLVALGLTEERARRLVEAENRPRALALTEPITPTKPPAASRFPSQDELVEMAQREADGLWRKLFAELEARHRAGHKEPGREAERLMRAIRQLQADTMTAGRLLGMLAPWRPQLQDTPRGSGARFKPIKLALHVGDDKPLPRDRYRFPFLEDALEFLLDKQVVTADEFSSLLEADKRAVLSAPGVNDLSLLGEVKIELANSLEIGESFADFRKRMRDKLALTRAQTETLFRTQTHQAYNAGLDKTLDVPAVQEAFPAVLVAATHDTRTRDEHEALDGFVCLRSDPAYRVVRAALDDYGCRCSVIPLSLEDAERRGLKTYNDLPAIVRAAYG